VLPELVILSDNSAVADPPIEPGTLYKAFERYEKTRQRLAIDACGIKNATDILAEIKTIQLPAAFASGPNQQNDAVLNEIRAHRLDVIVALGSMDLISTLSTTSAHGVWHYWHDFGQSNRMDGSSVGFWEVIKRRPYIRSALIIRRAGEVQDLHAYETWSGIDYTSLCRSRNEHLWKIQFFVLRSIQRMHTVGFENYFRGLTSDAEISAARQSKRTWHLTDVRLIFPLSSYALWRLWQKAKKRLYTERWILMFTLSGDDKDISRFGKLLPPRDRFWADPHVVRRKDDYYIFLEDASLRTGHGHIAVIRLSGNGQYTLPTEVISKPYHLSYPFVFEWNDEFFMIPESADNRTVELYKCESFPLVWQFVHNLIENISAYDTTLFEHDGLWWLFTNVKGHEGASSWDELCLYYSDDPTGSNWHPHPMNPVISDVRRARPAGRLFMKNGEIYRPSQNSSFRYGYGLNFNRILELKTTIYREQLVRSIDPNWSRTIKAIHSFDCTGSLVTVDAIYQSRQKRFHTQR